MTVSGTSVTQPELDSVAEALYDHLEPLAWADEENGWALLRYCAAIGVFQQVLHDLVSEDDDGNIGWSSLLDVNRCPDRFLRWLSQLVGEHVPAGRPYPEQRTQIAGLWNWKRGTVPAIQYAVARTLTGTKEVRIFERTDSPYSYTVQVRASESPDHQASELAARATKPAGMNMTFLAVEWEVVDGLEDETVDELPATVDELDE